MHNKLKSLVVLWLSGLSCVGGGLVNPSLTPPGGGGGGPTNGQTQTQVQTLIANTNNNVVIPLIQTSTNGLSPTNFVSYSWANGISTTNIGNAIVLDGFNPNGSIRVKGTNWPTGGGGSGSLFPPNAAGVLVNDGAGNTNWLSTNSIINTASNNVINVLPSRTNYYQVTNATDGNAVVIVGPDVSGQFYLKGTNWPTGGGSVPNGLVTNISPVVIVSTNAGFAVTNGIILMTNVVGAASSLTDTNATTTWMHTGQFPISVIASNGTIVSPTFISTNGTISVIPTNAAPVSLILSASGNSMPIRITNVFAGRAQPVIQYFISDAALSSPILTASNEQTAVKLTISAGALANLVGTNFATLPTTTTNSVWVLRDESSGSASVGVITNWLVGL